jgi:hypothetical protein
VISPMNTFCCSGLSLDMIARSSSSLVGIR